MRKRKADLSGGDNNDGMTGSSSDNNNNTAQQESHLDATQSLEQAAGVISQHSNGSGTKLHDGAQEEEASRGERDMLKQSPSLRYGQVAENIKTFENKSEVSMSHPLLSMHGNESSRSQTLSQHDIAQSNASASKENLSELANDPAGEEQQPLPSVHSTPHLSTERLLQSPNINSMHKSIIEVKGDEQQHSKSNGSTNMCNASLSNPENRMHLKWYHVKYSTSILNEQKKPVQVPILHGVTGEAKPGEMIAILGGSGAGKTTLLNILAGRISSGKVTGDIRVNGSRRSFNWKRVTAYVEQNDCLFPLLTVRETITFAAMMKSPAAMSKAEKLERVEQIIRVLGLTKVAESRIGNMLHRGISGGERKRVSIGVELVTDPRLIFLDEPTSGLDALTALGLMETIKSLVASDNRTVIVTIHQPRLEIVSLFTKIILMSQGRTLFFGHITDAIMHFEKCGFPLPKHENPTDFFIDMITADKRTQSASQVSEARVKKFLAAWEPMEQECIRSSRLEPNIELAEFEDEAQLYNDLARRMRHKPKHVPPLSFAEELYYLCKREWSNSMRRTDLRKSRAVAMIVSVITTCIIFFRPGLNYAGMQNRLGLTFIITSKIITLTMNPFLSTFAFEKQMVARERYSSTYRVMPYFMSKFLVSVPENLLLTLTQGVLIYYIVGLRTDGFQHFLVMISVLLMTCLGAISLGLCIAASCPNVQATQYFLSVNSSCTLLFGSSLSSSGTITWLIRWVKYISLAFYPYRALVQNELTGLTFNGIAGAAYIRLYSLNEFSYWSVVLALAVYTVVIFFCGYLALLIRTRPKLLLI